MIFCVQGPVRGVSSTIFNQTCCLNRVTGSIAVVTVTPRENFIILCDVSVPPSHGMASKTATAPAGESAAASKPKLVRPDQAKMEADVAALEAEAKRLDAQVTAVEADISARQAASSSNRVSDSDMLLYRSCERARIFRNSARIRMRGCVEIPRTKVRFDVILVWQPLPGDCK